MSDPGAIMIAAIVIGGATITIRGIATAVVRMQEMKMRGDSRVLPLDEARLQRIEHAVDSIAIEIERISENQRFTTKLLSERVTTP
jgi:hypothetical protein